LDRRPIRRRAHCHQALVKKAADGEEKVTVPQELIINAEPILI
jgi:hypothetical protein